MLQLVRGFRWVALLEGVSFLVLLGIAMPLKYLAGMPLAVRVVGLIHGVLFIAFVLLLGGLVLKRQCTLGYAGRAFSLSLMPFGTFFLERGLKAQLAQLEAGGPAASTTPSLV